MKQLLCHDPYLGQKRRPVYIEKVYFASRPKLNEAKLQKFITISKIKRIHSSLQTQPAHKHIYMFRFYKYFFTYFFPRNNYLSKKFKNNKKQCRKL